MTFSEFLFQIKRQWNKMPRKLIQDDGQWNTKQSASEI